VEPRTAAAFALRLAAAGIVPNDATALRAFADALGARLAAAAQAHGWVAEPPFPGATRGLETIGETLRLTFAVRLRAPSGETLGVAFTTLVGGRRPEIGVAPAHTPIPQDWA